MKQLSKQAKPKVALITGASSGIGLALAKRLAREGSTIIAIGRDRNALSQLQQEFPEKVECVIADLAHGEGVSMIEKLITELVPDLVVNNAGLGFYGPATSEEARHIIDVNCKALTVLTLAAIRALLQHKKHGIIYNVSSALAFIPAPFMSVYAASKAYVNSFSLAQDFEHRKQGICVLTGCPGRVMTNFRSRAARGKDDEFMHESLSMSPETVADEILIQIHKKEPLRIINWRTRLLVKFAHFLPKKWVMNKVREEITELM